MNLYWGGTERRITGLTLRILGVNAIALLILAIGILYLGQYKHELIQSKLETFKREVEMTAAALSEGSIDEVETTSSFPFAPLKITNTLSPDQAKRMVKTMSQTMRKRIQLFNKNGVLIADSHRRGDNISPIIIDDLSAPEHKELKSVLILKNTAKFLISILPDRQILPLYHDAQTNQIIDYPDALDALKGKISLSAWQTTQRDLFLSAAAPLIKNQEIMGAALLTAPGTDVEKSIGQVWADVLRIFSCTLIHTIILSIYLSGVIARPLRKLTRAAESVRTNKDRNIEIPDFSHRHDEIGELSLVLRDMTKALWDRMDSIESFAADVSHELKNPLTSLKSAVETAAIVKKKADQKKLLDIITHDIDRLDRLITDISCASRLDAELSREVFKKLDIYKLLYDLVDMYKDPLERDTQTIENSKNKNWLNIAQKGSISIRLSGDPTIKTQIWGLEGRLIQVFQNLISNALSFSPQDSNVTIAIKTKLGQVYIEINDEGPGVPPKKLKAIFERCYSQRPKHEAYGRHSGLGLSICKQIIEAHDGKIFAQNIKQKNKITGAKFTVILSAIK